MSVFCSVTAWAIMFAYVPEKGRQPYMLKNIDSKLNLYRQRKDANVHSTLFLCSLHVSYFSNGVAQLTILSVYHLIEY